MLTSDKQRTERAEQKGRDLFSLKYPSYVKDFSPNRYDFWDVSGYTSNSTSNLRTPQPYIAEIKVRNGETFNTIMIEKYKYEQLINYTQASGIPSFYINFFHDAAIIANLSKVNLKDCLMKWEWLPDNTVGDKVVWKWKEVYYIPRDEYFTTVSSGTTYQNLLKRK